MQTETTAPAVDTTATAPAAQAAPTQQTTTTPPASGQEGAPAGQAQPAGTAAPAAGQAADQYQQEAAGAVDATYNERAAEAARRIPDFVDVVGKADIQITHDMLAALKASAHGPDIVYALAKDPAEAKRIAGLPAAQMF